MSTGERLGVIGLRQHRRRDREQPGPGRPSRQRPRRRRRSRSGPLVGLGARAADSPARVGRAQRDHVHVAADAGGRGAGGARVARRRAARLRFSSISAPTRPPRCARWASALSAAGCHLLEAPLTGGAPGAQARMLVFMVGGEDAVYERVRPLLERLGRATFHLGPLGLGNTAKLVNSLLAFTSTWVSLEVAGGGGEGGRRPAHHDRRHAHRRRRQLLHRPHGRGHQSSAADRRSSRSPSPPRTPACSSTWHARPACRSRSRRRSRRRSSARSAPASGERDFTDLVELIERQASVKFRLAPPRG